MKKKKEIRTTMTMGGEKKKKKKKQFGYTQICFNGIISQALDDLGHEEAD